MKKNNYIKTTIESKDMSIDKNILLSGLEFPEGPRWRNGKLYFSDAAAGKVIAVDEKGKSDVLAQLQDMTSGLGFLDDGTLLVVSMQKRHLMRLDTDGLKTHADLSNLTEFPCNDCVTDALGRTYIGNWGAKNLATPPNPTYIILVTKKGDARIVAENLLFPNGCIVTPDCKTFIVAEQRGGALIAFDIGSSGDLSNRRVWAKFKGFDPDGICLDEEGAIWAANPLTNEVLRVLEGGEVTSRIKIADTNVYACALGGKDGKTLFLCTNQLFQGKNSSGRIEYLRVEVPGVEIP